MASVKAGREARDTATGVPERYAAPDFINKALQQSSVECTWDLGDEDRASRLTKWGVGADQWKAMAEGDDLGAYLASEGESDEDNEEER